MTEHVVKLRDVGTKQLGFTLPASISEHLEHLKGHQFRCELTDEGILYRPVEATPADLPDWVPRG